MPIIEEYISQNMNEDAGTMRPTLFGSMIGGGLPGSPKMAEVPIGWHHRSVSPTLWEFISGKATELTNTFLINMNQYGNNEGGLLPKDPYRNSTTAIYRSGSHEH